jgi:hypothetical protein
MKKIVVFAGLLTSPVSFGFDQATVSNAPQLDPRFLRLKKFFESYDCPLSQFAADFLMAADENQLDWRLLPGISMQESSGGKRYKNQNVFGWRSCHESFPSIPAGIHAVASQLGTSRLYRHKQTDEILKIYNPRPGYAHKVKIWMHAVSPVLN